MYNVRKEKVRHIALWLLFIVIALLFITLLFLPKDFFDHGKPICISVNVFHRECYACGLTRATQHLIHLDFDGAAKFNRLSFVVVPLLIYMIIWEFLKFRKEKKTKQE